MIRISIPKKLLSLPVSRSCDEMGRLHENRSGKKKRFKIVLGALTMLRLGNAESHMSESTARPIKKSLN